MYIHICYWPKKKKIKVECVVVIGNATGLSIKQVETDFNRTVPSEKWSDKDLEKRDYVITGKWNKDNNNWEMEQR